MLAMCRSFLSARRHILLAGWDMHVELQMVRGDDIHVGVGESPEQQALLESLRSEGLDDEALAFWSDGHLRVLDVLGFAARRGVRVGVLLWDAFHQGSHLTNDPAAQRELLVQVGVDCLLDDSSRAITHLTQSLHQKCAVVDGRVAFVGGIDLTMQAGGDYDRWDTHRHPCSSPVRASGRGAASHPWHDVHCRLEGQIAADVQRNIVERWQDVALRQHASTWPTERAGDAAADAAVGSTRGTAGTAVPEAGVSAQVLRTIPPATYAFAPAGIATIKQGYLAALAQARRFIYIENQYLWPEIFLGLDALRWGARSPDMDEILEALGAALARGVHLALTLPDHPNCGRRFTDGGVEHLRERAAAAGAAGRLHVFTLGNSEADPVAPGALYYRPVYTHAKVAIVDDAWLTIGSANLNSRGMTSDAEINIAALDHETAEQLRIALWTEHLRRGPHQRLGLEDPVAGLVALQTLAEANRERVRSRLPLVGHLLPYVTQADAARFDLPVHPEHGWLDNLPGGAGALSAHHAGRYL
jgi:phosphatidylserine/phosphatidylglycerophosphate/cardiolipin synthase-like enzyme